MTTTYPPPPGAKATFSHAPGTRFTARPCAALTWHGRPCRRPALDNDKLCNSHREQVIKGKNPVKLQGGGEVTPEPAAPVFNIHSGEELDLSGMDTSREPRSHKEQRRLALLQLEYVVQHGSDNQKVNAAKVIFAVTRELEQEDLDERNLDEEILGLFDAICAEAEVEESLPPLARVRQLVSGFSGPEMDEHVRDLVRMGALEPYDEQAEEAS